MKKETIHCIGIGGSGMLPLAELLLKKNYAVTGSDRLLKEIGNLDALSPPIRKRLGRLASLGAVLHPQDGTGIDQSTSRIVASTAIEDDNPDLVKANSLSIPALHRSEELCAQIQDKPLIAVTGTSGKSTTTALCAWLLKRVNQLGCFIGGAELLLDSEEGWTAVLVEDGPWNCAELDESDNSFLAFQPDIALVLNIKRDHHTQEENVRAFIDFCSGVKQTVILNRDDESCRFLADHIADQSKIVWFDPPQPDEMRITQTGLTVSIQGRSYELPLMGAHNAFNFAAALCAVQCAVGAFDLSEAQEASATFPGVRRRLHRFGAGPLHVYDDYAHNPDKLAALIACLQERHPRMRLAFQPHGYGPLRFHLEGYAEMFTSSLRPQDELFLLPVFDAGGTTNRSIASENLREKINQHLVFCVQSRSELIERLGRDVFPRDVIAVAGARDDTLAELAERIASEVSCASNPT